jgi:AraC family transcriptional regulator of adaptative response/methylated-DNA-[protein]-cysteine methyltransferase
MQTQFNIEQCLSTFASEPVCSSEQCLYWEYLTTPCGQMLSIFSDNAIFLLEFIDRTSLEKILRRCIGSRGVVRGRNALYRHLQAQLQAYYRGKLTVFDIPTQMTGTKFQVKVWQLLQTIPYGQTLSYKELAIQMGNEKAVRAVAGANSQNSLAIIVPCHRVIQQNGQLGGYAGGLDKKLWLLEHER